VKGNLGIVRKALRVGKNIEHFKAAAIALESPLTKVFSLKLQRLIWKVTFVPANASEDVLRYLAVGRQLGYGGYLTLDILTYVSPPPTKVDKKLHAAGIKSFSQIKRIQRVAFQFWLAGLVCNIVAGSYTLSTISNKKSGEKTAEDYKREARYISFLRG
jgi:hypothetical protein